jgi:signal transduction histidine kinase
VLELQSPAAARALCANTLTIDQLFQRDRRTRDFEAQAHWLHSLAHSLATLSDRLLQTLADAALMLCDAGSSGISLIEPDKAGTPVFRWAATAGHVAGLIGNTTPLRESPCGVTLALGGAQLFAFPQRRFDCLKGPEPEVVEGLVVPVLGEREPWGTIWVLSHDKQVLFDAEDARVLTSLASFVGAAWRMHAFKTAADARTREAEEARIALEASEARKHNAIAMITHELRNPMAPIVSALEVVHRLSVGNEPVESALRIAGRQMRQLRRLVGDLLDASRIRYNKVSLERSEVTLQDIVHEAVAAARAEVSRRRHSLDVTLPELPVIVYADAGRLAQVLSNVVGNAMKYTPDGGRIQLLMQLREAVDQDNALREQAWIRVKDSGVGIPAESLPHVFDMFTQSGPGAVHSEGGLGIGLAVVKHLVTLHEGAVDIKSDGEGLGTEVVIRLPVIRRQAMCEEQGLSCSPLQTCGRFE